jgi:Zn finger protein HypA/HybF involved in hydrogenase expression
MEASTTRAVYRSTVTEVPEPKCRRCDDWTTVVARNVIAPCPSCQSDGYEAWVAAGGRLPAQGPRP